MRREIGAVTALLAVMVSCRDGPTVPDAIDENGAAELTAAQRSTIRDLVDDPFVRLLVESVEDSAMALRLSDVLLAVSRGVTDGNLSAMHRVLTTARGELIVPADGEDAVVRAALDLVLDDVETSLENHERTVEPTAGKQKTPSQVTHTTKRLAERALIR